MNYVHSKMNEYLKSIGKSQYWLAKEIGADKSLVSRWCKNDENGRALRTPNTAYMIKILDLLNCDIKDLFELIE